MRTFVSAIVVSVLAAGAPAEVDLVWQVENQGAPVGETVRVGLYAVADNDGADEPFSILEMVLQWDPNFLALLGVDNNGPYGWLFSGFPADSTLDGLNDTFDDGNAYYQAWNNFQEYPVATPEGLLVTTLEFEALAATPGTDVIVLDAYGDYSVTAVYDDEIPGWNIVGDLGTATVRISGEGCVGDLDGDGDTDQGDLGVLLAAFGVSDGGDLDGDGDTDQADLGILLADWGCGTGS